MTNTTAAAIPAQQSDEAGIAARIDRIPTGRFHIRLALKLALGTFFDGFDAISLAVVLSIVVVAFKISFAEAGTIIAAGYLGQFVGAIGIGWLSERFGRKKTFVVSLIVFSLLSIGCALAWSATSLLIFRLIQGIGLGAEVPLAGTLVNEYLGRRSRGRVGVIYQSAFSWGLFFAPLVALVLTASLAPDIAWRVLLAVGLLPIVAAVWAAVALPESARWLASRGRNTEANALVEQMEKEAIARGVVLDKPELQPITAERKFKARELFSGQYGRRTLTLALLWFTGYFVVYGYSVWLPSIYVKIGGLAPTSSVLLTVLIGLVVVGMNYVTAGLVERIGRKVTLILGYSIAAFGGLFGVISVAVLANTSWPILFTTGCLIALGITIPAGALYFYTGELYPTRMRGFATSSASSVARIASVISPFIIGPLLDAGGAAAIFGVLGAVALVGTVVVAVAGIETRNRSLEEISA